MKDDSLSDDLKRESERLRELADKLKAKEDALAEMQANYPTFRKFVYAKLREEFEKTIEELPDKDLETYAQEQGAVPLEDFIDQVEQIVQGS